MTLLESYEKGPWIAIVVGNNLISLLLAEYCKTVVGRQTYGSPSAQKVATMEHAAYCRQVS